MGGKVIVPRVVLCGFLLVLGVVAWQVRSGASSAEPPPTADPDSRQVIYGVEGGARGMVEVVERKPISVWLALDEVCGDRRAGPAQMWISDVYGALETDGRRLSGEGYAQYGEVRRERVVTVSIEGELRKDLSGAEGTATSRMSWWIDGVEADGCAPRTVRWKVAKPQPVE